jgi:Reverse transcriptase (RNA-dependent DNA polymerase)
MWTENTTCSMGHEEETTHCNLRSLQVEGLSKCPWWKAGVWNRLLGNIRGNIKMEQHPFLHDPSSANNWCTRQVDFVLAYPQADIEHATYLEPPPGFEIQGNKKRYCLKLLKKLYGSKLAGRVWQQHLFRGLNKLGYIQSTADPCVFFRNITIFMVYTDDGVFVGPDSQRIEEYLQELHKLFEITGEGEVDEYLGVKIIRSNDGTVTLSQLHLIESILEKMDFKANTKAKRTTAST